MTASCVVLVAPTDALVGGSMSVPPADKSVSRENIVAMELSRTHKLSPGRFEMAWWDLPARANGSHIGQVHAVGLPHAAIEATLEIVSELGMAVIRTVPGSLALLAASQRRPIDPRCIAAAIDLGSMRGHLSLMIAGRVVHERALPEFSMTELSSRASEKFGDEPGLVRHVLSHYGVNKQTDGMVACETATLTNEAIQPLIEEIGMSFAYVSHLYPEAELGQLLLTGGGANIAGLSDALAGSLELETQAMMPSQLVQGDDFSLSFDDPALTMALGAALCGEVSG